MSAPAGAAVLLDSAATGETTDCVLTSVPPGHHNVLFQLAGFDPRSANVTVVAGETTGAYAWFRVAQGWVRTFGAEDYTNEEAWSVRQTLDDGYLIAGTTSAAGAADILLMKLNADGELLWDKSIGSGARAYGRAMELTSDYNCIIAGAIADHPDSLDVLLVRAWLDGTIIWSKRFGTPRWDVAEAVQPTPDGGFILTGYAGTDDPGDSLGMDLLLVKTNADGDSEWTRTYTGPHWEVGYSVQPTADGGYIVTGSTESYGHGSGNDVWLLKTDAQGDTEWTRTFGGTGQDFGYSVQPAADQGYIIVGSTTSFGAGAIDLYLIRTDAAGNLLWSRTYGGVREDAGRDIHEAGDGWIITGYTQSFASAWCDLWLLKTDAHGDTLWTRMYGSWDEGCSVHPTSDSGYIAAGIGTSDNGTERDVYVVKTYSDGNTWQKREQR